MRFRVMKKLLVRCVEFPFRLLIRFVDFDET
jgi:hypothetical protein